MTSSPGTRPRTALLALALVAWLPTSCAAAPQPEACAAYLACVFPEGGESPYGDVPGVACGQDDPKVSGRVCQADLAHRGATVHELYGPTGECWRNGQGDPLYQICLNACLDAIREECEIARSGAEREPYCVVGSDDERRFVPGGDESLSQSCVELEGS